MNTTTKRTKVSYVFMSTFTSPTGFITIRFLCCYALVWTRPNRYVVYVVSSYFPTRAKCILTWVEKISREPNVVVRPNIISIWCKSQHFGLFETWANSYRIHLNTILLEPSCCGYYVSLSRAWYLRRCNYYQKNLQWNIYSPSPSVTSVYLLTHFCP